MFKKVIKIILVIVLAVIFARSMLVLVGINNKKIVGNKIAVIDFEGIILSSSEFIDDLEFLEKQPNIYGIIIRVNSPGGGVTASNEIYDYIANIKKPVYVAMGSVAASGGYMIALGASKIYAMPSTITGSIGVIMSYLNTQELYKKVGIYSEVIKSGKFKDIGNPGRPLTNEDKDVLTDVVMDLYDQFVNLVSNRRNLDKKDVLEVADGRVFTGNKAKELKLIDRLGSWRDAFIDMKSVINIENIEIYEYEKEPTFIEKIIDNTKEYYNILSNKPQFMYKSVIY